MAKAGSTSARSRARALLLQALYQQQLTGHDLAELQAQFHARPEYRRADRAYFDELIASIVADRDLLEQRIGTYADRPVEQLDPVERSALLIGVYELAERRDIPYRVVINEAVDLVKRFGAVDGHKYVNAILDRGALELRKDEQSGKH
jgi:N utilization substance protein B